jgi:hypothetical protein
MAGCNSGRSIFHIIYYFLILILNLFSVVAIECFFCIQEFPFQYLLEQCCVRLDFDMISLFPLSVHISVCVLVRTCACIK